MFWHDEGKEGVQSRRKRTRVECVRGEDQAEDDKDKVQHTRTHLESDGGGIEGDWLELELGGVRGKGRREVGRGR